MFVKRCTHAVRAVTFLMSFLFAYFGLAATLSHGDMHSSEGFRSVPAAVLAADIPSEAVHSVHSVTDVPEISDCPLCTFQAQLVSAAVTIDLPEFLAVLDPVPSPVTTIARILKIDLIALQNSRAPPVG